MLMQTFFATARSPRGRPYKSPEAGAKLPNSQTTRPSKAESRSFSHGGFDAKVTEAMARGQTRAQAIRTVAAAHPDLHQAYVAGIANGGAERRSTASREWRVAMAAAMSNGLDRAAAVRYLARKFPELHPA